MSKVMIKSVFTIGLLTMLLAIPVYGASVNQSIEVEAGSIVVFSSTSLHRSSANTTKQTRRAYLAQYSDVPIQHSNGSRWAQAVPFLKNGAMVYDAEADRSGP